MISRNGLVSDLNIVLGRPSNINFITFQLERLAFTWSLQDIEFGHELFLKKLYLLGFYFITESIKTPSVPWENCGFFYYL
jgi:hypothetical protein